MTTFKANIKNLLAIAVLLAAVCTQANAAFVGDFSPDKWQKFPGDGFVTSFTETNLSITGGDAGSESFTDVFIVVPLAGRISFDWSYMTNDDPSFDPFGITTLIPAPFFTELSNPSGAASQTGTWFLDIGAGQTFSFTAWSTDGANGAATTRISNFSFEKDAPVTNVPEPGTLALLCLGLLGLSASRRSNG